MLLIFEIALLLQDAGTIQGAVEPITRSSVRPKLLAKTTLRVNHLNRDQMTSQKQSELAWTPTGANYALQFSLVHHLRYSLRPRTEG